MLGLLRAYGGLALILLSVMQARVSWRRLWGLSLVGRRCAWGYALAALLFVVGLWTVAVAPPRPLALVLVVLPAVLSAMAVLALLSSWVNRRLLPPDVRHPGAADPWLCEPFSFSSDSVQVPALLLRPRQPSGAAVCWVHGSGDAKDQFKWPIARALTRRGIAVMTFDLPGHGEHPHPFALPGALDVVPAALSALQQRADLDPAHIGVMGVSLGGALTIRALAGAGLQGAPLPRAVCLLETPNALRVGRWLYAREALAMATLQALDVFGDCTVASLLRLYRTHPRPRFAQPLEWVFDTLAPATHIATMPALPLLLVYGGRDPIAPTHHGEVLFERAHTPKEWRLVRMGSHLSLIFLVETAERVAGWFEERLDARDPAAAVRHGVRSAA